MPKGKGYRKKGNSNPKGKSARAKRRPKIRNIPKKPLGK